MTRFKRIVSMFLVVIMVMSLLPLSVIAEDIQSTHTVSFKLTYNGAPKISTQKVTDGELATEPEVSRTGYILEYWYTKTENGNEKFDFSKPVTKDLVLYARWKQDIKYWAPIWNRNLMQGIQDEEDSVTYTVTFDANGSDVENLPAAQTVKAGECAVEPADPTKLIHDFGGWYTDSSCTNPFDFSTPITSNITLYAKWNISIYSKPLDESHVKTGILEYEGEEYEGQYVDNELILVVKDGVMREYVEQLVGEYGGTIVGQIPDVGYYQIVFDDRKTLSDLNSMVNIFTSNSNIKNAELSLVLTMNNDAFYPNDLFGGQIQKPETEEDNEEDFKRIWWGHEMCNVPEAWEIVLAVNPNPSITMGLIDDSFDAYHEDLNFIEWYYQNGYYNPEIVGSEYPSAAEHGTHVAGIMGALTNNITGSVGVALNAKLIGASERTTNSDLYDDWNDFLTIDSYLASQFCWVADLAKLIKCDCRVINMSLGQKLNGNPIVKAAASKAYDIISTYMYKDFVIVTSAGNQGENDGNTNFNNAFTNIIESNVKNRIIVVGASSSLGVRESYSSYLGGRVDVMAPGGDKAEGIMSTKSGNTYGVLYGTSMASPFVAGLAGLILEANPNLSAERVKEIIISTANIDVEDSEPNMVNAEAAVIEALGYDPRTKEIIFKFIDTSTNNPIKSDYVALECTYYGGKHPDFDSDHLNFRYIDLGDNENTVIDTVSFELPYGFFGYTFYASGYQDEVLSFEINDETDEVVVYMTPKGATPPTPEIPDDSDGYILTGEFVYLNDANVEVPVAFAKCVLTDVTNSNLIYYAEVVDGKLSNESFITKPPVGTYRFELEGGDADTNGFRSYITIDNLLITDDHNMGKVYCDRVADVSCSVVDEEGEALTRVAMTITQNGNVVTSIDSFSWGFNVYLKKGSYTLTLTCDGYQSYTTDFSVNGTTELGTITLNKKVSFAGGDGSEVNPYQVSTPEQLDAVRNDLKAHYIQINDIDMSSYGAFKPIGKAKALYDPEYVEELFDGTYDGSGYIIKNITISDNSLECVGIFSACSETSILKNINADNATINFIATNTNTEVGIIAGTSSGEIINCKVSGSIYVSGCKTGNIGGIVGIGTANKCINEANITVINDKTYKGSISCGGIVGFPGTVNGSITMCINRGNIIASSSNFLYAGGISGEYGTITYSINYGNIVGSVTNAESRSSFACNVNVGGIFGANSSDNTSYCVNLGLIEGYGYYNESSGIYGSVAAGGIGGWNGYYDAGTIEYCYNNANVLAIYYDENSTACHDNAGRIAVFGGYGDNNSENYSTETLVNGVIPSEGIGDTQPNGAIISQDEFSAKLNEIIEVINN